MKPLIILIALAVLLAGCDEVPAMTGSGAGRCFNLKSNSAFETLGGAAGFAGSVYMRSFNGAGTYDQWVFLADGSRYGSVWVYVFARETDHPSGWQAKFEGNRVCIDRQLATESGTLEYVGRYER